MKTTNNLCPEESAKRGYTMDFFKAMIDSVISNVGLEVNVFEIKFLQFWFSV